MKEKVDMLFLILTACLCITKRYESEGRIQIKATAVNHPGGCLKTKIWNIFLSFRKWKMFFKTFLMQ